MLKSGFDIIGIKKSFNETFKLRMKENESVLDLSARTLNIFTKVISESEIGVYGDYAIYVFYLCCLNGNEKAYRVKKLYRTFAEILILDENKNQDIEGTNNEKIVDKAWVEFEIKKQIESEYGLFNELDIAMRICIDYFVADSKVLSKFENKVEENEIEVWHYRPSKIRAVDELINMDSEFFKSVKSNKKT